MARDDIAAELRKFCDAFAFELAELEAGRLTSFKTLLVRIRRIAAAAETEETEPENVTEYFIRHGCDRKTSTFVRPTVVDLVSPLLAIIKKLPEWANRIDVADKALLTVFAGDAREELSSVSKALREAASAAKEATNDA